MNTITFIDTEVDINNGKVLDIGAVKSNGEIFHSNSFSGFKQFLKGSRYICGHNIFNHDLEYLKNTIQEASLGNIDYMDTLFLSPLLFPTKPYHALLKDDKLLTDEVNNPLNDSIKSRDLFFDEVNAFSQTDNELKQIFYSLLKDKKEFRSFFLYLGYRNKGLDIEAIIRKKFKYKICEHADLGNIIDNNPIPLAYCLSLINSNSRYSVTPPWVLKQFPDVDRIMYLLRNKPCLQGCAYCNEELDIHKGLKRFFGFDSYRKYAGEPLQERAVRAAVANKSLLAIFPTGGGKSLTFQLPALMSGYSVKGLTVVISPLQSLMKDQVDNLEKIGITEAVTVNGLLDPIERAKALERVENGSASILYISPESLRSRTIERLLLGRNIVRFVIDEAHCFSAWGQDFRVDYLYIGDFIRMIIEKKNPRNQIPVSCFTATAKQKVIEDICEYFRKKLELELEVYSTNAPRTNLHYRVFERGNDEEKYSAVRDLLDEKNCPTIIYVSRTKKSDDMALRLVQDGYQARAFHGRMDKQQKTENQDAFIRGDIKVMVSTSAFGMGVDKKDVGMVIHYDISDSLENYIQESGRAGRDESITADCYVLYNEEDLNKHFLLLNQSKISINEIQQVWKAIKDITKIRSKVSQSALEIARKAGWDDNIYEIETRVTTAIAALEEAGYLKRGQNMPRVFADSILVQNAMEANKKIRASARFDEKQKETAIRIVKMLISNKNRKFAYEEDAEARVDYIADILGLEKETVIDIVNLLREENILADSKDLIAYIKKKEKANRSLGILKSFWKIEEFLLTVLTDEENVYNIKDLNEQAEAFGCNDVSPKKIVSILNLWAIRNWIKKQTSEYSRDHIHILRLYEKEELKEKHAKRHEISQFIIEYLYESISIKIESSDSEEALVQFSVLELKEKFNDRLNLLNIKASADDIEDALFYLSRIDAMKIEGGFLVVYNALTIERLEQNAKRRYIKKDYKKLDEFYHNKVQQIHIVGEYAKKMLENYKEAMQFVDDYFQLSYPSFLNKYFKGDRQNEISKNITPSKFRELFGTLSPTQFAIINDSKSKYIVVAAGPGSGKTRILVHKLASLMLMEDVKHEQMLMLTFSRSAASEFKKRLIKLVGNAANFIEIKTFHSYCFDLLGRLGTLEKSGEIIKQAINKIKAGEVEAGKLTKTVLVIDEAQDMDADEFELIKTLMEENETMRVIAVGDDDQNIFEFRGSSSKYMEILVKDYKAVQYELVENYRSKSNLVDFSNQFATNISSRLKKTPIAATQKDKGILKLIRYRSTDLITPLVEDILSEEHSGTTCVLTRTNEEAMQITGLLKKYGMPARLIQTNDSFNLYNLLEIRFFSDLLNLYEGSYIISDEDWATAKRRLKADFARSSNLDLCFNLIETFEGANPKYKYKTDFKCFIRESKLEDFYKFNTDTIFVSTMHKAKGREFDSVFLLLDQYDHRSDEAKRLIYVAITRARQNLVIHCNTNCFDYIKADGLRIIKDSKLYQPPEILAVQLTYRDVWLDYFMSCQDLIWELTSGDTLIIDEGCCCNKQGFKVLRFSRQFIDQIENMKQYQYIPGTALVRFIVYWQRENTETEIKIILPEIYFHKIK